MEKTNEINLERKVRNSIKRNVNYEVPESVIKIFEDFINSSYFTVSNVNATTLFSVLLNNRKVESVEDFSDVTFYEDFKMGSQNFLSYKKRKLTAHEKAILKNLYSYLLNVYPKNFKNLTMQIINFNTIFTLIDQDYTIIKRNIFEDTPLKYDKWILIENEDVYNFDFTQINQKKFADGLKRFIWEDTASKTKTKKLAYHALVKALNTLPFDEKNIGVKEMMSLKNKITKGKKTQSAFIYISHIRAMLNYFEDIHLLKINKTAWNMLKMQNVNSKGLTEYYTKEEMQSILEYLNNEIKREKNEKVKILYQLQMIAILYVLNTAMRFETVSNLKISDLQRVDNNNYYIADSKTEKGTQYNITSNIKKLHDEVVRITEPYRNENSNLRQYLFVYSRPRGNALALLDRVALNKKIQNISLELGIKPLGLTGIRNRFMNNIVYSLEGDTNKALIQAVSKHSINVHYNHYFENNIKEIAVKLYGVTIGETELKGIVTKQKDVDIKKTDVVLNGRGYCSSENCSQNNGLDCLMCRYFRCTPLNIPYFKNEIEKLDKQIEQETIEHEKEFKIARKKLNVEYLFKCYEIQNGGIENGNK